MVLLEAIDIALVLFNSYKLEQAWKKMEFSND